MKKISQKVIKALSIVTIVAGLLCVFGAANADTASQIAMTAATTATQPAQSGNLQPSSASVAAAAHMHPHGKSMLSMLWIPLLFGLFYVMFIRPQSKRAKEHRDTVAAIGVGDEVETIAGIIGRIVRLRDDFVVLAVADKVEITLKKAAISTVLPKGTLDSIS